MFLEGESALEEPNFVQEKWGHGDRDCAKYSIRVYAYISFEGHAVA
jgi:hypothetical protein